VRGLKLLMLPGLHRNERSHPARVRGLKQATNRNTYKRRYVAPRTGARIETFVERNEGSLVTSHPARVRGLKLLKLIFVILRTEVAPRTGARIETSLVYK